MKKIIFFSILALVALSVADAYSANLLFNLNSFDFSHAVTVAGSGTIFANMITLAPVRGRAADAPAGRPNNSAAGQVADLSNAISALAEASSGATLVDRGSLKQLSPRPTNTIFIVNNIAGGGAAAVVAYMFNEDYLNATPDDNGSGAGSVEKSYNDGFEGNLINRIMASKGDTGLKAKQLQMQFTTNATGLQSPSAVNGANPTITAYNGDNSSLPQSIPLATTGSPSYQQAGYLIINLAYAIQRFAQLSFNVPVGVTATVTVVYE